MQLHKRTERCYNRDLQIFYAVNQYSYQYKAYYLLDKSSVTLKRIACQLLAKIKRQYYANMLVVRLNSNCSYSKMLQMFKELSIVVEH